MRISAAVQAHPDRAHLAEPLAALLEGEVVYDPDPAAPKGSAWRTYRRALELTPAWATHRLIVQDDAELCPHFTEALPLVVAARPDKMIALCVLGSGVLTVRKFMEACHRDEPFVTLATTSWIPAIAVLWPAHFIEPGLAFVDKQRWPERFNADDEIIGRICRHLREKVEATVPSLVEHPDVEESLLRRDAARAGANPHRVAACMIPDECDARLIDWAADTSPR